MEISIVLGGEVTEPHPDDPRIEAGGRATYNASLFPFNEDLKDFCTDGPILARYDDGTEIRVPPPVCTGGYVRLSLYATAFGVMNDTSDSVRIWVEHDGELYVPIPGEPELQPGDASNYALKDSYSTAAGDGRLCVDGDVFARSEDGVDMSLPGSACDGDSFQVSEFTHPVR